MRVALPPGCTGLDARDGTKYHGSPGGSVTIEDKHVPELVRGSARTGQMLTSKEQWFLGTKRGRRCPDPDCSPRRTWNAWSTQCPKCGTDTVEIIST